MNKKNNLITTNLIALTLTLCFAVTGFAYDNKQIDQPGKHVYPTDSKHKSNPDENLGDRSGNGAPQDPSQPRTPSLGDRSGNGAPAGSSLDLFESLEGKRLSGEPLSREELDLILFNDGYFLKEKYLINLVAGFLSDYNYKNMEPTVKELHNLIFTSGETVQAFIDSARYAKIIFGDCPPEKDFCLTGHEAGPMSPTIIDKEQALKSKVNLKTLVALLFHETVHKFYGDIDHDDHVASDYPITRHLVKNFNSYMRKLDSLETIFDINNNDKKAPSITIEGTDLKGLVFAEHVVNFCRQKHRIYYKDLETFTLSKKQYLELVESRPELKLRKDFGGIRIHGQNNNQHLEYDIVSPSFYGYGTFIKKVTCLAN